VRRALARVPDPPDAGTKFFAFGELLLVAVDKKVTRHQGGIALSISRQMVRAQARTPKLQIAK
jgi:hypothetical protein